MTRQLRGGLHRTARPLPPYVTPERAAVLELAIQGLRADDIGAELGIHPRAAAARLHQLRVDTGCRSTLELAFLALRRGWYVIDPLPFEKARKKP